MKIACQSLADSLNKKKKPESGRSCDRGPNIESQ